MMTSQFGPLPALFPDVHVFTVPGNMPSVLQSLLQIERILFDNLFDSALVCQRQRLH